MQIRAIGLVLFKSLGEPDRYDAVVLRLDNIAKVLWKELVQLDQHLWFEILERIVQS